MQSNMQVDVLIIGGGMAGLTAAATASRAGASVLLVERAPEIGGAASISGGYLWTAPTLADLQWEDPDVDPRLGATLTDHFLEAIEWVESLGLPLSQKITGIYGFGHGFQTDVAEYLRRCRSAVEAGGGWVSTGVETRELCVEGDRVVGAIVEDAESGAVAVAADHTVLATGGFQANPDVLSDVLGDLGRELVLRSRRYSTGEGLRLALSAGALRTEGVRGFYGHLVPSPMERLEEKDFIDLAQLHSGYCLLINRTGKRFTDETLGDHVNNQLVVRQPDHRALLIADEHVRRTRVMAAYIPGMQGLDKFELAASAGARLHKADTLEGLVKAAADWVDDPAQLHETLTEYNRLAAEDPASLSPPSSRYHRPLDEPPYYALEVRSAITFPYAGIATDPDARVLGPNGPIPGLLVAGVDAGGIYKRGYAGGLARGLVFGRRAGLTAVGEPSWADRAPTDQRGVA